jgi:hypothetical protein
LSVCATAVAASADGRHLGEPANLLLDQLGQQIEVRQGVVIADRPKPLLRG